MIHAFAEANKAPNIFMAKWDIKDGFWQMDCTKGEEWNFAYLMPQPDDKLIQIVVPTSLKMRWVKSPPYFCGAMETSCNIAITHIKMPVNSIPQHKFEKYVIADPEYKVLPETCSMSGGFLYMVEVYINNFMSFVISIF